VGYSNVKLIIGGLRKGEFIETDSYSFPKILVLSNNWPDITGRQNQLIAVDEEKRKLDLNRIRKTPSDSTFFKVLTRTDSEELLLYDSFEKNKLVSASVDNGVLASTITGDFSLVIEQNGKIFGNLSQPED